MQYKDNDPSSEWAQINLLNYEDILEDVLSSNCLFFNFEDPDVQRNFSLICKFMLERYIPLRIDNMSSDVQVFFIIRKKNGEYRYPATPERINYIIKCLHDQNFDDIQNLNRELFGYDSVEDLQVSPATAFGVQIYPKRELQVNEDRGGHFFNYLIKSNAPYKIIEQLKRYQIFPSIVDAKNKCIEELEDCCFIYALKMTKLFTEDILNKMRLRIRNRYLSNKHIDEICREYKIHIKLHYLDDETTNGNKNKKIGCNYKRFIGVTE